MILSEEQSSRIVLGREIIEQETSGIQAGCITTYPERPRLRLKALGYQLWLS